MHALNLKVPVELSLAPLCNLVVARSVCFKPLDVQVLNER